MPTDDSYLVVYACIVALIVTVVLFEWWGRIWRDYPLTLINSESEVLMDWKAILKSFLSLGLTIAYGLIISRNPDFPLAEGDFTNLLIYIIGGAIGGWQLLKVRFAYVTGQTWKEFKTNKV